MITLHNIFEINDIDPKTVKLVRHGNKEIPVRETFLNDLPRFEMYQSFQIPKKFGTAAAIAVFAPYHKTTAIFLGLWNINGCILNSDFNEDTRSLLTDHKFPERWFDNSVMYDLKKNPVLDDLSERLIIEWGGATVAWVQSKDKVVVEIKGEKSIGDFQSFSLTDLSFAELKNIIQYADSNQTWVTALSSVNGIYLIQDKLSGKLYVGSAYGEKGIFGRWANYAQNGHGNNQKLKPLDPEHFQFLKSFQPQQLLMV